MNNRINNQDGVSSSDNEQISQISNFYNRSPQTLTNSPHLNSYADVPIRNETIGFG